MADDKSTVTDGMMSDEEMRRIEASKKVEEEALDNNYWRGFKELYNDPEFHEAKKHEFTEEEEKAPDLSKMSIVTRRRFLALMGASAALAAAGCADYRDKGEIVPYNKKPEEVVLGIPDYYASTCTGCAQACGLLVKTREGRPIKVDGNPDHPVNKGKICTKGQASILNLYDPGRLREPLFSASRKDHAPVQWKDVDTKISAELKAAGSKEIAIVTHTIVSPTAKKLFDDFKTAYPTTRVYSYEVFNDSARRSAWAKSYGKKTLPVVKWEKANVILALESDFLGNEGNQMEQMRQFTNRRDVMSKEEFNRLYVVEGGATLTGLNADYRMALRTDAIEEFVMCLLNEVVVKKKVSAFAADSKVSTALAAYDLDAFVKKNKLNEKAVKNLVNDFAKNQGASYVSAGDKLPESTHIAVNLLNEALGASKLYEADVEKVEMMPLSTPAEMDNLVQDMKSGKIGVIIHYDTNPVFHLSPDHQYADALTKVPMVVTFAENINETADSSNYILAINDQLESWGDAKTRTGIYSTQQPVIAPLYNTRQKEAILLTWLTGKEFNDKVYQEYLISNWEKDMYPRIGSKVDFKQSWFSILHDGVVLISEKPETNTTPASLSDAFVSGTGKLKASNDFVLLLQNNNNLGDGRFAHNGWLQELPNPVSKVVWDNYAAVSVQTASELGVNNNDLIDVVNGNKKVTLPVYIQPGVADKVIEVNLGYGRTVAGPVGTGVGVDVNKMISKSPALTERFYNDSKVYKASGKYELISTAEYHAIDDNPLLKDIAQRRHIIQEGTYEEYKKNPKFLTEMREELNLAPINKVHEYNSYKWGMSIDLNKCTGCGACITACNSENNIPTVGKESVSKGRAMMWIRLDRYYAGSPDAPKASFQPMLCQHCDFAPCENVCPVAATTHTPDGLNAMAYNRCVGTRYCSNNCPFKVRRFNYFNWRNRFVDGYYEGDSVALLHNPEVTVRSRGVMEKCTFCLQRIMTERQNAIEQNRNVKGENVKTACQDACPAFAIQFGDINDKESTVYKYRTHELGYHVLEEIKVAPNVTYIAKLRNILEENISEK
jgi:molybdopterin-containing oxidoreductase family iron-sulfur binding subunit